jgi:CRP-like cAMP-binding protein
MFGVAAARRIARVVLRLAEQAGRPVSGGVEIEFPLRRQDVAQLTGTTLHSASRVLSRWEEENVVVSNRQRIVVRDAPSLMRIAEGIHH